MLFYVILFLTNRKTQAICDIFVPFYSFLIAHCPDKYITQKTSDEAVDDSLAALKFIPD